MYQCWWGLCNTMRLCGGAALHLVCFHVSVSPDLTISHDASRSELVRFRYEYQRMGYSLNNETRSSNHRNAGGSIANIVNGSCPLQ